MSIKNKNLLFIVFAIIALLSQWLMGVCRSFNHDESQFIASAWLIKEYGQLPIIDYVYYHQPAFSFVYAFLFEISEGAYLYISRVLSALSVTLSAIVIVLPVFNRYKSEKFPFWILALSLLLFLLNTRSIRHGLVGWNHAFPTLLLLIAFIKVANSHKTFAPKKMLTAGCLFALSVALRASLAPMLLPLFLGIFFFDLDLKKRINLALNFFYGCLIGALPVFIYLAIDPNAFLFNLVDFHTEFDQNYLEYKGRSRPLSARLSFAYKEFFNTRNGYFIYSFIVLIVLAIFNAFKTRFKISFKKGFWLAALIMALIGAVMKNVTFPQYYYLPMLFVALLLIELFNGLSLSLKKWVLILFSGMMLVSHLDTESNAHNVKSALNKLPGFASKAREEGLFIKKNVVDGKVFTLSPSFVVEGEVDIYKIFATSPFAYRTRSFVPDSLCKEYNIIGSQEIDSFLNSNYPDGIYTGWEGSIEGEIIEWAKNENFKPITTPLNRTIWVKP